MALYAANSRNAAIVSAQNLTTVNKCLLSLSATTIGVHRAFVYEFEVGTDGLPNSTDCAVVWEVHRFATAIGTGNAGTITTLDSADSTLDTSVVTVNHTIEPTTMTTQTALFSLAANQRASYRWVVNPGGPGELVVPATNLSGLAFEARSSTYALTAIASIFYRT